MCSESAHTGWKRHWVVAAVAAVVATMAADGQSGASRFNQPTPSGFTVLRDIEYVPGGHERQKLDLYLPQPKDGQDVSKGPRPLIIWVHGGAWRGGSKDRSPAVRFVDEGYAVTSINYRLSQHAVFPAQVQDCKAAVRWLRANAGKYGYDPNRFGVSGGIGRRASRRDARHGRGRQRVRRRSERRRLQPCPGGL